MKYPALPSKNRIISGKLVLILFLLANALYVYMLTVSIPAVQEFSQGMPLLDMMPLGYDIHYVKALFDTLGPEGRSMYRTWQLPVDMVYPALFGLAYGFLLAYLLQKIKAYRYPYFLACFLPFIAAAADYAENFGIFTMLEAYPRLSPTMAKTTTVFSVIKSMSTTSYFVILIVVLVMLIIKFLKRGVNNT